MTGIQALERMAPGKVERREFEYRRHGTQTLIAAFDVATCKLNNIDPQVWLADVLGRINDHSIHSLDQLLPLELEGPACHTGGMMSSIRQNTFRRQ